MKVHAGTDPITGKRHDLTDTIPTGPTAKRDAQKALTRLLGELDEKRNPRTRATVGRDPRGAAEGAGAGRDQRDADGTGVPPPALPDLHRRPAGGPHDDAPPAPDLPTRCPRCGNRLKVRHSDAMHTFSARLSRYREDRPALYAAARRAGIAWQHLVTTPRAATVDAVTDEAMHLLGVPPDVALAHPDRGPADSIPAPRSALEDLS